MGDSNKLDNPDLQAQQTWFNYGGVAPSISEFQNQGNVTGTAITTINVDTGIAITGPVVRLTGSVSGFTFNGSAPATISLVSPLTTKGDLYVRNSTSGTRLPVGTDGQVLTVDSAVADGVKWADASSGGDSLVNDLLLMGG
jgi:hypothetical protein